LYDILFILCTSIRQYLTIDFKEENDELKNKIKSLERELVNNNNKQIDLKKKEIDNKNEDINKKKYSITQLNSSNSRQFKKIEEYEKEIKKYEDDITKLTKEINTLEIKFDQANRLKIQTQKNRYERPIKLLEIDIDSKDKSIKDIDEQSKNSGQSDMTPISNSEKDYFNYVINFIDVYTSGKDSKNIIQRMFEKDAIVKIYDMKSPSDQIKELKKIPFFKKQDESFFNFFQRGGAHSSPEPFTETVKKYMLDIKKINTFYIDAYFNYLARVNKEFNCFFYKKNLNI
jgi:DNA repair exonuclease SbcCD ATPase subunit